MAEYYFDLETTGLEPNKDKIITIQWQRLNGFTGEPFEKLNILKEWESSEKDILLAFLPKIRCENPFNFIIIGKNLLFDFQFLNKRSKNYGFQGFDLEYCYTRAFLDLKPILVLMNKGNFKGYDRILDVTGELDLVDVPQLYKQKKYEEIIHYIKKETDVLVKALQVFKRELPNLKLSPGFSSDD